MFRGRSINAISDRRRAVRLAYASGALWAIGNGLTTGPVISYFIQDFGAQGFELSLLLALPMLVGLVRLVAPAWIRGRGGPKRACLQAFAASYLILAVWPIAIPALTRWSETRQALAVVIGLICAHQLLEFIGAVALFAWFADFVPLRVRGRFFARRNIWQLVALIPALLASARFVDAWRASDPNSVLTAYAIVIGIAAVFLFASLTPLWLIPSISRPRSRVDPAMWSSFARWFEPLAHRPFMLLLAFGCWLSFFNGLTQVAQGIYTKQVLGISLAVMAGLQVAMRVGQIGVSAWAGPFSDRYGNRPALVLAQVLVAAGPLCYFLARPGSSTAVAWIGAAYLLWSAYAVLNVCQNSLLLKLAPPGDPAPAIALFFAITSLVYAAGTVLGGVAFDWMKARYSSSDLYAWQFLTGWLTRTAAVVWLLLLPEPGARRWREIVAREPGVAR